MSQIIYQNFDLLIERVDSTHGRYRSRVVDSPAGQATSEFILPFDEKDLEIFLLKVGRPRRGVRRIDSPEMAAAREFGSRLFDAAFGGSVAICLERSEDTARSQNVRLRIRLRLTDAPELVDLPWEYLHDTRLNRFYSHSVMTPIVRHLDLPRAAAPLAVQTPLRILTIIASPTNVAQLDVEEEWKRLNVALSDLQGKQLVQIDRLPDATLSALQRQLRQATYHILHFVGHGGFDPATGTGGLLLEDSHGLSEFVDGDKLGMFLSDHRSLRLCLLNACEGARSDRSDPFSGVAQRLLQLGIPAVIAMQFEITDNAAITLAHEFYGAIADGLPVDAALGEGRKAIYADKNDIEWGTPVLYMRADDGQLFNLSSTAQPRKAASSPLLSNPQPGQLTDTERQYRPASNHLPRKEPRPTQVRQKRWFVPTLLLLAILIGGLAWGLFRLGGLNGGGDLPQGGSEDGLVETLEPNEPTGEALFESPRASKESVAVVPDTPTSTPTPYLPQPGEMRSFSGIDFVYIPGGTFIMGSTEEQIDSAFGLCKIYFESWSMFDCQRSWYEDESPQSLDIHLPAFWIMQYEVTNTQFREFIDSDGYINDDYWTESGRIWRDENDVKGPACDDGNDFADFDDDNKPVVCISWYEALAYTRWLSDKIGMDYRLPTEAEWEKAARGEVGNIYPWGDEWNPDNVNYCDSNCPADRADQDGNDGYPLTAPVGQFEGNKSPYNAYDMAGNVREWTRSEWTSYPYFADDRESLSGDAIRSVRGGSWDDDPNLARTANRNTGNSHSRKSWLGFRLVLFPDNDVGNFLDMPLSESPKASKIKVTATPAMSAPTNTGTNTDTPFATNTATAVPIQPTATSRPTSTSTRVPANTPTLTPTPANTATETPIPPTPTPHLPQPGEMRAFSGIDFVYVPGGTFIMGSTEAQIDSAFELCKTYYESTTDNECQRSWYEDEKPQSSDIHVSAFWIMQYEVTNAQFREFIRSDGYTNDDYWTESGRVWRDENDVKGPECADDGNDFANFDDDDKPVTCISWYEALAYARWLSVETGMDYRLPTEAEWEKAARGEAGNIFPWGDDWEPENVNYCDSNCPGAWADKDGNDGYSLTAPIGQFEGGKSPYNAYDMAGNVWEWTSTKHVSYPYVADDRESPDGDAIRAVRSGSWFSAPDLVRAASRLRFIPRRRRSWVGVRLVLSPGS